MVMAMPSCQLPTLANSILMHGQVGATGVTSLNTGLAAALKYGETIPIPTPLTTLLILRQLRITYKEIIVWIILFSIFDLRQDASVGAMDWCIREQSYRKDRVGRVESIISGLVVVKVCVPRFRIIVPGALCTSNQDDWAKNNPALRHNNYSTW